MSISYNWKPSKVAFLDFESQSSADLPKIGAKRYAADPSTCALTCCVMVDGRMHEFGPYLDAGAKQRLAAITEGCTIAAHNAPFDYLIWEKEGLPKREWFDTLTCARAAGLPGGLDRLSVALGGRGKDKNGGRLVDMLCCVKNGRIPAIGPAHRMLLDYNRQDVQELAYIFARVKDFGEPDVMDADRVINDRGIPIDREFLSRMCELFAENRRRKGEEFDMHTGGVNPRSSKQVLEYLASHGFDMADENGKVSIGKPAILALLNSPDEFFVGDGDMAGPLEVVREAVMLRREVAGVGQGKADKALSLLDSDDRITDQFVYFGAHTGRWTSRGLQLHNMPSMMRSVDTKAIEPAYAVISEACRVASEREHQQVTVSDALSVMLRRMVLADNVVVADYSTVEARCLAWMAGCQKQLAIFSDPKSSVYIDMGNKVFQKQISKKEDPSEYTISKSIVLGCGYGMGGHKFQHTMEVRLTRDMLQVMADAQVDAFACVKQYREAYPEIPALWNAMHAAVHDCVAGIPTECGRCLLKMVGADMHAVLPSGRPIVYRNARIEMIVPGYCKVYGLPERPVPTVVYDGPAHKNYLFGAKLVENLDQGMCRDLVADTLVKCEQESMLPIIHVHDEVVCADDPDGLDMLLEIMTTGPAWAAGMPLSAEGYSGKQWSKHTDGYTERTYMLGKQVK